MIPEGNFFKDTGTQITPMARALPGLNYYAMVRWALDYTASNTLSEYYGDAGNNCANFASQVLNAGGWPAHRDISMRVRLIR